MATVTKAQAEATLATAEEAARGANAHLVKCEGIVAYWQATLAACPARAPRRTRNAEAALAEAKTHTAQALRARTEANLHVGTCRAMLRTYED